MTSSPGRKVDPIPEIPIPAWRDLRMELLWATRREVEPHYYDSIYFGDSTVFAWFIERGSIELHAGDRVTTVRENEWMFPGYTPGRQFVQPGTILISIRFSAEWPTGVTLFDRRETLILPANSDRRLTRTGKALQSMVRRVSRLEGIFWLHHCTANAKGFFHVRLAFDAWMVAYVDMMTRVGNRPTTMAAMDPRILNALRVIDTHRPQYSIPEGELASRAGLGVRQLIRLFVSELGASPKQYMESRRLQRAISLLQYQQRPIKEVAYELGFSSPSHFSAWFTRHKQTTPRAFQKRLIH